MKIKSAERFRKSFDLLQKSIKKKTEKQFRLFLNNMFYPSLHSKKLIPKEKNIWSFRIDKNYRVIFTFWDKETILFLDIGPHDIYKKF